MSDTQPQPSSPQTPAIIVENLVKTYAGVTAVNRVSFTVNRGEIIGFLGPNGAGKSTTMRILTGYLPATSGRVEVCGLSVASHSGDVKKLIGYMPENNPLPEDMRVSEYLHYRGRLKEVPRRKLGHRIDEVLELCDLKRVRHRILGKLSKGFRQRVGIAEAILAEPPVIIMDEPTIGLDPHQILIVRDLIASLRGRMTVIISSHILPEIEMTCDRVLIINGGRLVATGTPAELRQNLIGPPRYDIEFAGDPAEVTRILATFDPALQLTLPSATAPDGYYLGQININNSTPAADSPPPPVTDLAERILAALAATPGLRIRAFAPNRATLEDVFLAATRRTWDAAPAQSTGNPKSQAAKS